MLKPFEQLSVYTRVFFQRNTSVGKTGREFFEDFAELGLRRVFGSFGEVCNTSSYNRSSRKHQNKITNI